VAVTYFIPKIFRQTAYEFCFVSISFILLTIIPITVQAEDPADIGEIRVEADTEQEVAEAPSSFATVIRPEEENATFENVSELISAAPGVTSRSLGGLGQFSTVSIRGSSPEQVSVYLDGVRLNTASGGAFDFSTIPLDAIDRIEVIRGGGVTQFGSDAIGGVINIITKTAGEKRAIEAFAGGGSFTTIKVGSSYRERFKKNSLTLSWTHLQSKGDFTFKTNATALSGAPSGIGGGRTYTRIHNGFISESFLAQWEHKFSENFKLRILNDFFFTDRQVPGTEGETTLLYPTNLLEAKERIFRNTNSITVALNKFFIDQIQFNGGVTNNLDINRFKDPSPALGNPIDVTTDNYSLNPFLKWEVFLDHKIINQIITLRYDYRYDYLSDSSPLPLTLLTGQKTRHINSLFLQDEIAFLDDKIIFLPSARYEDASDFPDDVSFKGGLKVSPLKWLTFKTNFEKTYRYPNFNELYFPDQGYIRGNPNLNKEKAWNLDAGFNIKTKYASLEVAYFRNWVDNLIIFVPISATTIAPVNTFKVNIQGVEVGLTAKPIKYVRTRVSYTFLDAHYASNNNQLPGRPKHEFYARLDLSHDWGKKFGGTIFGKFNYRGAVPINAANSVFLAARSQLDLGINLRFAKHYYLIFEVKDVTNVQTYDARGFPLPRRSFFATLGGKWS
jgi:iron complex outermembrane receptor protein